MIDPNDLLSHLNDRQREAVAAPLGNILILAGAGSGKTRVLVNRIAWLIQSENASPFSILAVTFTNKAAGEMRSRLEQILGFPARGMWVGTFHGLAHRLLRAHWQHAGLDEQFQILDSDDQLRMIKRVLKSLELDPEHWPPRQAQWFINHYKDQGHRPDAINPETLHEKTWVRVYSTYEQACARSNVIDFAELLLRAHELFGQHPEILQHYQERFRHILVDEFQDTNTIQYAWLKRLANPKTEMMIVGDDDQSIYGWRGAQVGNIKRFCKDFANVHTIRLEQNYRSTQTILTAANALIGHNDDRLGKALWTSGDKGEPIVLYSAFNDLDEARYITEEITQWAQHQPYKSIAILYRSNAQSRVLEEALITRHIPYRIYGGLRFFERAEIRDALAYLRLIANPHDDPAIERVINMPTRGIGEKTLDTIRTLARSATCSLWQAANDIITDNTLSARAHNALAHFIELINNLSKDSEGLTLDESTDVAIKKSGLWAHYQKSKNEKAQAKIENLAELITAAKQFSQDPDDNLPLLTAFLTHAALEAGEEQSSEHSDCVQLMTLHSAKGLEFPCVFLAGVEEGLFPHQMSLEEEGRLNEERRLCYVGMTRAMQKLVITHAEVRRQHGRDQYHRPSRFISEIPEALIAEVRTKTQISRASQHTSPLESSVSDTGFNIGELVFHPKFGEGTIVNFEGSGEQTRIQIKFKRHGTKWLVKAYANLQAVD